MKYLNYAESCLEIEQVSIEHITQDHPTPFYCYSKKVLIENISDFFEGVKILDPKVCYSLKANSNISLLKLLSSYGTGADVVSEGEFRKAMESGIKPSDIVFSGVGKTDEELTFAIKNNCFQINIESGSEILRVEKIANQMSKTQSIAIRLNPDVDSKTHEKITTGTKENKFGIPLHEALQIFKDKNKYKNVDLNGIAVHIGSDIKTLKPFLKTLKILKDFCEKIRSLGIELNTIDLGGGLSPHEREFDIKEFALATKKELGEFNAQFIFEPGRIISADAGILVTKIVSIKNSGAKKFIIVDAGMNDLIRPALYGASHKILPIKENIDKPSLTDNKENEYGDLILDLTILFPTKLDSKRIDILRKIFNYKEDLKSETSLVAYHYKDKEDIVKELMNEENNQNEEEPGCIQQ